MCVPMNGVGERLVGVRWRGEAVGVVSSGSVGVCGADNDSGDVRDDAITDDDGDDDSTPLSASPLWCAGVPSAASGLNGGRLSSDLPRGERTRGSGVPGRVTRDLYENVATLAVEWCAAGAVALA